MKNILNLEIPFYQNPEGFLYWYDDFNSKFNRIWIQNLMFDFTYSDKINPSTIWGFVHKKTKEFYSPINHKKPGKLIKLEDTTPYSAMKLNLNPLEALFL